MATLEIKSDLVLLLRKLKNPWIWILFFRVAKIWQSGLPYLWRIWRYNFKIDVRWWAKHQLKWPCIQILWGNFSRIVPTARPPVSIQLATRSAWVIINELPSTDDAQRRDRFSCLTLYRPHFVGEVRAMSAPLRLSLLPFVSPPSSLPLACPPLGYSDSRDDRRLRLYLN